MFLHFDSLRTKLLLATLSFLAVIAVAFALLVSYGFSQTQQNAKQQSIAGLQAQGRSSLQALVEREGQLTMIYLQQPATASRTAAEYMPAAKLRAASDTTAMSVAHRKAPPPLPKGRDVREIARFRRLVLTCGVSSRSSFRSPTSERALPPARARPRHPRSRRSAL